MSAPVKPTEAEPVHHEAPRPADKLNPDARVDPISKDAEKKVKELIPQTTDKTKNPDANKPEAKLPKVEDPPPPLPDSAQNHRVIPVGSDSATHGTREFFADHNPLPTAGRSLGLATAGMTVAAGTALAELPILGNIPYLPAAAEAIKNGILGATNWLNLNTGAAATNGLLASVPGWVGPAGLTLAGLYGLGYLNQKLFNSSLSGGPIKTLWNGLRSPYDLVRHGIPSALSGIWNGGKNLFSKTGAVGSGISKTWNYFKESTVGKVALPTWLGTGAGIAGAALLAPFSGGSSIAFGGLGYFGGNILKRWGWLGGGGAAGHAPAAAGHH